MKQGSLPPRVPAPRKAWNTKKIKVVCGIIAVALLVARYMHGGPWKIGSQEPAQPKLAYPAAVASGPDPRELELRNGWITNCTGPDFSQLPNDVANSQSSKRPVFKINDQLTLAVPAANYPSAASIESEPVHCRSVSDLPPAKYLSFAIVGNWSAGYKPEDVPVVGGGKQFRPDVVAVRIQPEFDHSTLDEKEHSQEMIRGAVEQQSTGTLQFGHTTCFLSKWSSMDTICFRGSAVYDNDFMSVRYGRYAATPFVLVIADYPSIRFGGIHVFWKAWILDPSRISDADEAIWKSVKDWNLLNHKTAESAQR